MDPSYRNPYTQQINAGFQYAPNNFSVIEVDYVQARGLHDDKTVNINPVQYFGAGKGTRPFSAAFNAAGVPQLGRIADEQSIGAPIMTDSTSAIGSRCGSGSPDHQLHLFQSPGLRGRCGLFPQHRDEPVPGSVPPAGLWPYAPRRAASRHRVCDVESTMADRCFADLSDWYWTADRHRTGKQQFVGLRQRQRHPHAVVPVGRLRRTQHLIGACWYLRGGLCFLPREQHLHRGFL